ncbi:hypothetical protein PHOBOS_19 [Erwinia phage vB_EamM_Phobos]|uniref:hypothetical protein n=1 Tax=Erwinia phage vB_EamM_Phobos TaxID=1883377 RepID=UPI00081D18DE|nr:hypothetical protein BIZ79_gp019 [Erwinia phage vB_EamM_Phobos]ANZ50209.1 hypothetical protein PHOBOS_19 [Erwinia phage vB_EamM_Phobos]
MHIQNLINLLKLSTFSGTVEQIGTTTYFYDEARSKETVCLDITIRSITNPNEMFLHQMGIIEFAGAIENGHISVGDKLTVRKYPLQTYYTVKEHTHRGGMFLEERRAVRYMVDLGIKELDSKLTVWKAERGLSDLNVMELRLHLLRAINLKCKLG